MEGSFPYGDIIVIAAVAAFILLRYRAMLGEPRGKDNQHIAPKSPPAAEVRQVMNEIERVIQLQPTRSASEKPTDEASFSQYGSLADTFVSMRAIDREFAPDEFLSGAKMAYEMVIDAFSKRDRGALKTLLSADMYKSFALSLDDAEKEKRLIDTTLVAISKAAIKDAKLRGTTATLTVDFTSEQIHLVRDEAGTIIEGNASQKNIVEDEWVFTRDLKNSSPNWTIIET